MTDPEREQWRARFADALAERLEVTAVTEQFSLLALLAEDPANGLYEVRPGMWCSHPVRPDPGA